MTRSASELIHGGKIRTDVFEVCLDPDLVGEYEALIEERDKAREAKRDSLAGGATVELDEQIGVLLERMQEATLVLTFQALPRPQFRALADKCPQRKDEDGRLTHAQDIIGVNADTFFEAVIPLSLVDPELSPEDLTVLVEQRLTDRQWEQLTDVIWRLNRGKVDLPFSLAASKRTKVSSPK